jgi:carboxymethylenebutenolidase
MDPVTLQAVWKAHTDSEFITKDVESTLETMTEDAFVLNVPTGVGALGKDKVHADRHLR